MRRAAPIEIRTPAGFPIRCFMGEELLPDEAARRQLDRLAAVPGLEHHVVVLPDVHAKIRNPSPTGTVVVSRDVIVPRAIGFPGHNCGMRTMATPLPARRLPVSLLDELFGHLSREIPSKRQRRPLLTDEECADVLVHGPRRLVEILGLPDDEITRVENGGGMLSDLDPDAIRKGLGAEALAKAVTKGVTSLGTLGSGNHFLELQEVAEILDPDAAERLGVAKGSTIFMLHTDSQRLGKKILEPLVREAERLHKTEATGDLWSVPVRSDLGHRYLCGLAAATHAGFANRALITHILRRVLREVTGESSLDLSLVFDTGHETIQKEAFDGEELWVHRHGASRALPPAALSGDPLLSEVGQPVCVPGSMGTSSYLAMTRPGATGTFHSVAHGAGRVLEKHEARERWAAADVEDDLRRQDIRLYRCGTDDIAEQAPGSFKSPHKVVEAMTALGLIQPVARTVPIAVLKG